MLQVLRNNPIWKRSKVVQPSTLEVHRHLVRFEEGFPEQVQSDQPYEIHMAYLATIPQRSGESLEGYHTRYKKAVNKVETVNETESLVHIRRGLNPYNCEKYICDLMKYKPTTLAKAYELASYFITETEAMKVMT